MPWVCLVTLPFSPFVLKSQRNNFYLFLSLTLQILCQFVRSSLVALTVSRAAVLCRLESIRFSPIARALLSKLPCLFALWKVRYNTSFSTPWGLNRTLVVSGAWGDRIVRLRGLRHSTMRPPSLPRTWHPRSVGLTNRTDESNRWRKGFLWLFSTLQETWSLS